MNKFRVIASWGGFNQCVRRGDRENLQRLITVEVVPAIFSSPRTEQEQYARELEAGWNCGE
jgi:hypothetical protein